MENKTELAQAIEAREQAKAYLEKAEGFVDKASQIHDITLASQRKIAFALSSLIGKPVVIDESAPVEDLLGQVVETAEQVNNRNEMEVISTLVNLALANRDVIEISIDVNAHNNMVGVDAVKLGDMEKHQYENVPRLLRDTVWLDDCMCEAKSTPLSKLLELEDKLIDLIAEAREKQESEVAA